MNDTVFFLGFGFGINLLVIQSRHWLTYTKLHFTPSASVIGILITVFGIFISENTTRTLAHIAEGPTVAGVDLNYQ